MPRHRVLIVEDEHDIAGLIKHTLERAGDTEAHVVGSGDAALKAVADEPPDLIILDLNLPVVSGVEVCRILRSRSDARHVPIIMLTARTTEDDRVTGLELGADDYVTKPFSLRELSARVRAVLRRSTPKDDRPLSSYRGANLVRRLRGGFGCRKWRDATSYATGVRAAALSRAEQESRGFTRSVARARLGIRPVRRNAIS